MLYIEFLIVTVMTGLVCAIAIAYGQSSLSNVHKAAYAEVTRVYSRTLTGHGRAASIRLHRVNGIARLVDAGAFGGFILCQFMCITSAYFQLNEQHRTQSGVCLTLALLFTIFIIGMGWAERRWRIPLVKCRVLYQIPL